MHTAGSIPLGRWLGVPVRLDMLFFMVFALQLLGSIYYGPDFVLLWAIVLGPVLLITVLFHELGHCLAAKSVGGTVEGILLWPLGGLAFIGHTAGPKADMWVAVAGPLTHIPMTGIWLSGLLLATHAANDTWDIPAEIPYPHGWGLLQAVCFFAIWLNVSLFAFNLLIPAYPLDGGRILVDSLLALGVSHATTAKITIGVAVPIALAIVAFGAVIFQVVTILVGLFILFATFDLYQHLRHGLLNQHPMFAFSPDANSSEATYWKAHLVQPPPTAPVPAERQAEHAQV